MIRQPTPYKQLYAWHRAAISGQNPPRHDGLPECGWYKLKRVKGGPWVPARIYVVRNVDPVTGELTDDEKLRIEIEGRNGGDPAHYWTYLTPITREEFASLSSRHEDIPIMAATMTKIDLTEGAIRP